MTGANEGFEVLAAALADAGSPVGVAELHGALCGVLCVAGPEAARAWLDDCLRECDFETSGEEAVRAQFHELQWASWAALTAAGMEFAPLLPDDDTTLQLRVQALALWCHGFVTGLGLGGLKLDQDGPAGGGELDEIIRDLIEISRASFEAQTDADADGAEFSFVELTEFVRVGVQIVFEEVGRRPRSGEPTIH